jgi:hypothetical protein
VKQRFQLDMLQWGAAFRRDILTAKGHVAGGTGNLLPSN